MEGEKEREEDRSGRGRVRRDGKGGGEYGRRGEMGSREKEGGRDGGRRGRREQE